MIISQKRGKITSLMKAVDEKSRQIIAYLLRERHAGIRKLADLIYATSDMEVLIRIREVINPKAQKVFGKPLIKFERSKIDPLTGEKVVFSWWLTEDLIEHKDNERPLDIFDEKNGLRVIACLPPQEQNINVEVRNDLLIISGKKYHREIPLLYPVEKMVKKTINNGILEVKLNRIG